MPVIIEHNKKTVNIDTLEDGDAFEQDDVIYIVNRSIYSNVIAFSICGKHQFTDTTDVRPVNLRVIVE